MTADEKKAYNNGFILGMASKGVIVKKEKPDGINIINARESVTPYEYILIGDE